MEDKVKSHSDYLKSLERFTITKHVDVIDSGLHHFSVSQKMNDKIKGVGTDYNKTLALKKAVSELAERKSFVFERKKDRSILSSNGFAAHTCMELAKKAALKELIERDLFFISWLAKRPPAWVLPSQFDGHLKEFLNDQVKLFEKYGYSLKIGIIGKSNNIWVVVGVLLPLSFNKNKFGCVFSAGSDQQLGNAIQAAVYDHRRMVTILEGRFAKKNNIYTNIGLKSISSHHDHIYNLVRKQIEEIKQAEKESRPINTEIVDKFTRDEEKVSYAETSILKNRLGEISPDYKTIDITFNGNTETKKEIKIKKERQGINYNKLSQAKKITQIKSDIKKYAPELNEKQIDGLTETVSKVEGKVDIAKILNVSHTVQSSRFSSYYEGPNTKRLEDNIKRTKSKIEKIKSDLTAAEASTQKSASNNQAKPRGKGHSDRTQQARTSIRSFHGSSSDTSANFPRRTSLNDLNNSGRKQSYNSSASARIESNIESKKKINNQERSPKVADSIKRDSAQSTNKSNGQAKGENKNAPLENTKAVAGSDKTKNDSRSPASTKHSVSTGNNNRPASLAEGITQFFNNKDHLSFQVIKSENINDIFNKYKAIISDLAGQVDMKKIKMLKENISEENNTVIVKEGIFNHDNDDEIFYSIISNILQKNDQPKSFYIKTLEGNLINMELYLDQKTGEYGFSPKNISSNSKFLDRVKNSWAFNLLLVLDLGWGKDFTSIKSK